MTQRATTTPPAPFFPWHTRTMYSSASSSRDKLDPLDSSRGSRSFKRDWDWQGWWSRFVHVCECILNGCYVLQVKHWYDMLTVAFLYLVLPLVLLLMRFDTVWWDGAWPARHCLIRIYHTHSQTNKNTGRVCAKSDCVASEQHLTAC